MISSRMWWVSRCASAMVLAGAAAATGCADLIGVDWGSYQQAGGAAISGGGGAAGSGGGGVVTSGAGAGSDGACVVPEDCPGQDTPCQKRVCDGGWCGLDVQPAGAPAGEQIPGDCKSAVCDGAGAVKTIEDDGDPLDDGKDCTIDACDAGTPKSTPAQVGASCDDGGGKRCDGMGSCVRCLTDADCAAPTPKCSANLCVPVSCGDGVKNGTETDVDCGGACGPTCSPDASCQSAADCLEGVCDIDQTCAWPACGDGVKNGTETDVDCGGACGPTCGPNEGCDENADCTGSQCSGMGGACVPNCDDEVQNGAETGVDCGGGACDGCAVGGPCAQDADCDGTAYCHANGTCQPKGTNGAACLGNNECASTFCVDGVCCNTACSGTCQACAGAKTGGASGTCAYIPAATDPDNECLNNGANDVCNGAGACKEINGTPCFASSECLTGYCVDGFCCNTVCSGTCQSCSAAKNGGTSGACGNITTATDPDNECAGVTTCNGSGACTKLSNGSACTLNGECSSGHCVDGVCCNTSCTGTCMACSAAKTGGANGTCASVPANADPDSECLGGECNGAGACELAAGMPCSQGSQCISGACHSGTCGCMVELAVGADHACAVKANGFTRCWGYNYYGQIGDGSTTSTSTSVQIDSLWTYTVEVAAGQNHTCARRFSGEVSCWGANSNGQVGDPTMVSPKKTPFGVGISSVVEITAGGSHTCSRKSDNSVWCWGANGSGQLGDGNMPSPSGSPVQTLNMFAAGITAGGSHTCARKADNSVWCWGDNGSGQLGDGTTTTQPTPVQVGNNMIAVELTAGSQHTCARKSDGSVWCWGYNGFGQLGTGNTASQSTPVQVPNMIAVEIAAGHLHTCARKADNSVWCWGYNGFGQVGNGNSSSPQLAPVQVAPLGIPFESIDIEAGWYHTCARKPDGTLWCWGQNDKGQLGDGTTISPKYSPVQVTPVAVCP